LAELLIWEIAEILLFWIETRFKFAPIVAGMVKVPFNPFSARFLSCVSANVKNSSHSPNKLGQSKVI
jgi:hypothetical protein